MIKRYECFTGNKATNYAATLTDDGPWVFHDDHAEAMQKLWKTADTRERMNGQTIATLRAEVERWVKEVAHLKLSAEKAERERDDAKGKVFRRDDFIIELQHEIESARDAARGENALRLEAERERDTLRAQVERWVKEVAHLKLAAEKAEREERVDG